MPSVNAVGVCFSVSSPTSPGGEGSTRVGSQPSSTPNANTLPLNVAAAMSAVGESVDSAS